jgi:uncharacterized protein (DUF1697 family)
VRSKSVYILLFRGVGGATQLPTAALREALTAEGFEGVATYINSGNAVLRSELPRETVITRVAATCKKEFRFEKAIFAPTLKEWIALIERNPFPDAVAVPKYLHMALLAQAPRRRTVEALKAFAEPGERLAVVGKVAYIHTPNGFGTSKLAARFDKGIGVTNTARNWNTVSRLRDLAERLAAPSKAGA